jgi:RNA polymerase sigma-70 factor (ECF subfamily)
MERLCAQLREPYRTVATLYFCKGVRLSAYAAESGIPLRTLETQLYRAKKQLRILWKEEDDYDLRPK